MPLENTFVDLGVTPLANSYVPLLAQSGPEYFFPLHARVCASCFLVQVEEMQSPDTIFTDYAYYSSYSDSWLAHCKNYADMITRRYALGARSQVIEIASNDGYLLQYFLQKGIPVLGIEPAANVAKCAVEEREVPTKVAFFSLAFAKELAAQGTRADLLIGNNVLAHVPDINDFVAGMREALADEGVITMEFPHLLRLIQQNQFDTIYHEHFSYLSLHTVRAIFARHGLLVFDVDILPTHGGSIRIYATHQRCNLPETPELHEVLQQESDAGLEDINTYTRFAGQVQGTKRRILKHLIEYKEAGLRIAAYGAPAKGNTLLNYCGIGPDFVDFTVDRNPAKQNTLLPGSRIPVYDVAHLIAEKPDVVILLPWNLRTEIIEQLRPQCDWPVRFVTLIPNIQEEIVETGEQA